MTHQQCDSLLAVQAEVLRQIYDSGISPIDSWQLVVHGLLAFHLALCEKRYEYIMTSLDELRTAVMSDELDKAEPDEDSALEKSGHMRDDLYGQYDELSESFGVALYLLEQRAPTDRRRTLTRETMLERFKRGDDGLSNSFVRLMWFPADAETDARSEQVVCRRTEMIVSELRERLFQGAAEILVDEIPARLATAKTERTREAERLDQLRLEEEQRARVEQHRRVAEADEDEIPF